MGFTRSNFSPLDDLDRFHQLTAGSYKSEKPVIITGIDKMHLKADCIQGTIVNSIRELILYSFALSSPPGHIFFEESRVRLLRKINKSVLTHLTFFSEDDDHKSVGSHNNTISFTCQLNKI